MKKEQLAMKCEWKGGVTRLALTSGEESSFTLAVVEGPDFRMSDCQYIYNLAAASLGPGHYRIDILIDGTPVGHVEFSLS